MHRNKICTTITYYHTQEQNIIQHLRAKSRHFENHHRLPRIDRRTMACDFTNFCMNFCAQVESVAPPKSTTCSPWHRPLDPTPSKKGHDENDINTHASEKRRMRRRLKRGILRSRDSNCTFACVPTCTSMDSAK